MRATAPGQSTLLLLDVIDLLDKRHIAYAVIGAFAVINIQDTFHNRVDLLIGIRGMTQEVFQLFEECPQSNSC